MLEIVGNVITLTRGDTARFTVPIVNDATGTAYVFQSDDKLYFTIRRKETDKDIQLQKVITASNSFHIKPADTKDMNFGKYIYDVQLVQGNGDTYTVIPPTQFNLASEVTY